MCLTRTIVHHWIINNELLEKKAVNMNRNLKLLAGIVIGIAVFISVIVFCYIFIIRDVDQNPDLNIIQNEIEKSPLVKNDPFIEQMVGELKRYYGKTISEKSTQAGLIGIRDFIMRNRPENRKAVFYTILMRAFPDYAHEIVKTLNKLDLYNQWLQDNKRMLSLMSATERNAALWAKRRELFGDDAEKIWSGDLLATEARKVKMQDTLAVLNKSDTTTIDEKIEVYQGALRDTYNGSPEEFFLKQNDLMAKIFFSIDSVQDQLKKMSPDQRQLEINRIRKKMGFSDQQIETMARRDADNTLRWETGLQYMKEREAVVQQYNGPEQEEKLKVLREQYFDDEAKTIELEEKDDFYRFKRPHIYGRN
jgi:hypothetical protein